MSFRYEKAKALNSNAKEFDPREIRRLIETLRPSDRVDPDVLSPENLKRMASYASIVPRASGRRACLLDVGGRVYWIPVYAKLLGYHHVTILERPGGSFFESFQIPGNGEEFIADTVQADAELDIYPVQSESFQCVVCFDVLEHLAGDPMHFVAESNRVLQKGGYLCLATPNVLYYPNLVSFLFGGHPFSWSVFTDSYADRHNREYTPMEVQALLEAGGFSIESLRTWTNKPTQDQRIRFLGYGLCLLAALTGHVKLGLRGAEIEIRGQKVDLIKERFPKFLYDLFGANAVSVKLRI